MPRQLHLFDPPDRFVAGTVGQPGERAFFLQAAEGGRLVSVGLEKVQVAVLAERLGELLDEVRRRAGPASSSPVPPAGPATGAGEDTAPLASPIQEDFRVGTMALAWDGESERVVIEALAQTPESEAGAETEAGEPPAAAAAEREPGVDQPLVEAGEAGEGPDVLRVRITASAARAFVRRAERVVAAGRPPCPLCGLPLDPEGHVCPRQNGHRH